MNTLLAATIGLIGTLSVCGDAHDVVVHRQVETMGTVLWMDLEVKDRAEGLRASEGAIRTVEAAEGRLSTWTAESELARFLATNAGEQVELTPLLALELEAARRLCEQTGGAFDPSVGALTRAWGLRSGGRTPSKLELERARAARGNELWQVQDGFASRKSPALLIDEGGFGKGAALDQAIAKLAEEGVRSATVNLGGQLAFLGDAERTVPIADPANRGFTALEIKVIGGSVATSANTERAGHLIDPRTGLPADDFGSVTVWAESALAADALSTGLFVLGPRSGLELAEELEGVEAVFIAESTSGRKVYMTSGLSKGSPSDVGGDRTTSNDPEGTELREGLNS